MSFRARTGGNVVRGYLDDGSYLEISRYEGKWIFDIHVVHWEKDNPLFLADTSKIICRVDRFLPEKWYEKYYTYKLNQMFMEVAGVKIEDLWER